MQINVTITLKNRGQSCIAGVAMNHSYVAR